MTATEWLIGAHLQHTAGQSPQLERWTAKGDSHYVKIESRPIVNLTSAGYPNLYQFLPSPPLDFQAGNVVGLWQPELQDSQVVLYHETVGDDWHYVLSGSTGEITKESPTSSTLRPLIKLAPSELLYNLNVLRSNNSMFVYRYYSH